MQWRAFALAVFGACLAPAAASGQEPDASPPAGLAQGPEADASAIDRLFVVLRSVHNFEASFQEEKHLKLLVKPLKSSGRLYFERDRGLVRDVQAPRRQKLRLTETALTSWNGTTTQEIKLGEAPDLTALALALPRILRGDRPALDKSFDVRMRGTDSGWWLLSLAPKEERLGRVLRSITVIGQGATPHSAVVLEASGDRTATSFSAVRKNVERSAAESEAIFRVP